MKIKTLYIIICIILAATACKKKNVIVPVIGTIGGNPAVSLYGTSNKATDYMLIDTAAADKKISYDGNVFSYLYNTDTTIYLIEGSTPAAQAGLSITATNIVVTIKASFTRTFGSTQYISK